MGCTENGTDTDGSQEGSSHEEGRWSDMLGVSSLRGPWAPLASMRTRTMSLQSALELAGYGRFHYWLAFICGWANASDAVEILCISFLLPSAGSVHSLNNLSFLLLSFSECDLELTPARKGWLSAILFVGMMIGGELN